MMLKTLTTILLFSPAFIFGQSYPGALKLNIQEKAKSETGKQIIANDSIRITLNDSLTYDLTTDQEGYILIKNLKPGNYRVKALRKNCQALEIKDIRIGEGKTAYVTFLITCPSYINRLSKREKKKLGYK